MRIKRFRPKRHFNGRFQSLGQPSNHLENQPPNDDSQPPRSKSVRSSKSRRLKRQKKTGLVWQRVRGENACNGFSELDELQPRPKFK